MQLEVCIWKMPGQPGQGAEKVRDNDHEPLLGRKTYRLPFEYGLLAGISSVRELLKCFHQEGYDYLLTCRTNQDCVEVFFGCMRGRSG